MDAQLELAGQRTRLAFQRTRLAADRTLLAIMRTSLALIGFGFTLFQFLAHVREHTIATRAVSLSLVTVGFVCQLLSVWKYLDFRHELREEADKLVQGQLMAPRSRPAYSLTLGVAFMLVLIGLTATVGVAVQTFVD